MKRLIALLVSLALIALILLRVDRDLLWANLQATRLGWFALALLFFIPQNLIMAWRWKRMASLFAPISWSRAIGMILGAQTLNIVLPSKLGDLTKAVFLKRTGDLDLARATNLVVFEKMLDMGALCLLALLGALVTIPLGFGGADAARLRVFALITGLLSAAVLGLILALYFIPTRRLPFYAALIRLLEGRAGLGAKIRRLFESSHEVMAMLQTRHARRGWLATISIVLWLTHLAQIYCFFLSLNAPVPPTAFTALMPLAIFIGLLPISLFVLGTRDAAMIFLFAPWHAPAVIAGCGFYVSLRYVVPALAGLPFLQHYLGMARELRPPASDN